MTPQEIVAAVIDALEASRIPYMLVGSLSCNCYAIPRSTQDADFVVQAEAASILALAKRLGPEFQLDRQTAFETVTATKRYLLGVSNNPFTVELFLLSDDEHDLERFSRRRHERFLDRDVAIPTAEDVIVTKLRWSQAGRRTKDVEDVRNVIAVQWGSLDWSYIYSWCEKHGTREILDGIRASLSPLGL
mgnify:CR=1 FL=1